MWNSRAYKGSEASSQLTLLPLQRVNLVHPSQDLTPHHVALRGYMIAFCLALSVEKKKYYLLLAIGVPNRR